MKWFFNFNYNNIETPLYYKANTKLVPTNEEPDYITNLLEPKDPWEIEIL